MRKVELLAFTEIQPVPPDFQAGSTGKWLFTIWAGGFALLLLPYCLYRLKKGDNVAILAWLGGWIVSLGEPMLDHLGHLWWPTNLPGPAFKGFDLDVPALIPPCYVFFVAVIGYFHYRCYLKGATIRQVFLLWLAFGAADLALELPGVMADVYKYYGDQPFYVLNFPLHWGWLNATGFAGVGFTLWAMAPRLHGWKRVFLIFAPVIGFLGAYGITAWPAFLALNWNMSPLAMHVVDLGSLALCLLLMRGIAEVVGTDAKLGQLLRRNDDDLTAATNQNASINNGHSSNGKGVKPPAVPAGV